MKEKTTDGVILTPMYKGEVYKYHECSNCKKEIYFEEEIFKPFHFKENIKYCPFCGKEVIRYAKPKFIEQINWDWLDEYRTVVEKMYKELQVKLEEFKIFKPMPAPIDKIQNRYRYRIIIKGNMTEKANKELNSILKQAYNENLKTTRISIDINPNNMS